ncbi:hypothetical conserved protein (plasmid) [Rhizobium etli CFN 42]|uniref:Hypothetical conserved protein n=1 Tax=Rhizobium etli (strain ATCC 51251 / DSM 11541 / JCM 21823 / NBRC 15573 / CFN 42) TaxID=347834 RepID=Q2K2F4_RHIEC|nr:hypothetical conserved protein [Rhizobium etli CFN 42]
MIAGVLNRNGLTTGNGNRWTRERVTALRSYRKIPVFRPQVDGVEPWLNLGGAAKLVGITPKRRVWRPRLAILRGLIRYPMAHGSSAVPNSPPRKHVRSSIAPGRTLDTPQDRIQIRKTYSLPQHKRWAL